MFHCKGALAIDWACFDVSLPTVLGVEANDTDAMRGEGSLRPTPPAVQRSPTKSATGGIQHRRLVRCICGPVRPVQRLPDDVDAYLCVQVGIN